MGGYVIWDRKAKGTSVFQIRPSKPRLVTNACVMQPQGFNLFRLWALGEVCASISLLSRGCYWLTVWARLAEGCGEQPAARPPHSCF